ncbi:glycosyl transferase [Cellvibrio zantedeschiae]|uniref:Glycosyl transferase n=1 Tax=Cellvibrio zantedeschiae TaxID=1237077 RepID=A0ABQ3B1R8_9GAMM|nr:glycosyltransferase family 25 protein [Cellvibrio zantedeschiae]GGY74420.1 glycosyl transferase [Cellvibrio zantedeschiae]
MKSYLINLDKDTHRLGFFKSNFERLGIPFERISAVDGRTYSDQDYQNFMSTRPRNYNRDKPKTWLRGQMGCFLSHYCVWKKIAEGRENFCAVFEDDIHISDDLKYVLQSDSWIPQNIDVIRLETSTNRIRLTTQPVLSYKKRNLYGVKSTSWCAGAYIINRKTAQRLVALSEKYHEPADVMLYHFDESVIAKDLNILQFNPALCTQDKHLADSKLEGKVKFSSNIEFDNVPKTGLTGKLKKYSPVAILTAISRSLNGYRRISF